MTIAIAERALPHSLDAERSVLGAILIHNPNLHVAERLISRRDFYRDAHARIFDAMTILTDTNAPIDLLTLTTELSRLGMLDEVGGPSYVSALVDGVPRSTNVEAYAAIVAEKARLRRLIYAANQQLTDAYEADEPATAIVERGLRELADVVGALPGGLVAADEAVGAFLMSLDETTSPMLHCGYADLEELLGGFRPGDLVVVAARPSVGKTAFVVGLADSFSSADRTIVFFPIESRQAGIARRLLALWSHVPVALIERKLASERDYARVGEAAARKAPRFLIQQTATTLAEIGAWARQARQQTGDLGCVVVDYLQLLSPERRRDSEHAEVAAISRGLKLLAKELDCVVLATSQLSRSPETRRDKRPQLSDLRASGAIEQDCDVGILLYRPEMHDRDDETLQGVAEVIVAKNREGATGLVRMCFLADQARFADLAR